MCSLPCRSCMPGMTTQLCTQCKTSYLNICWTFCVWHECTEMESWDNFSKYVMCLGMPWWERWCPRAWFLWSVPPALLCPLQTIHQLPAPVKLKVQHCPQRLRSGSVHTPGWTAREEMWGTPLRFSFFSTFNSLILKCCCVVFRWLRLRMPPHHRRLWLPLLPPPHLAPLFRWQTTLVLPASSLKPWPKPRWSANTILRV